MKTTRRAWLFFALSCVFLMGSPLFHGKVVQLGTAAVLSPIFRSVQDVKKQLRYVGMAFFDPQQIDRLLRENQQFQLIQTVVQEKPVLFPFAKIVMRPLDSWSSMLWIEKPIGSSFTIEEDSPVVAGSQLLGVVEKIKGNTCMVRLLGDPLLKVAVELAQTDGTLSPSGVRTLRGDIEGMAPPYWGEVSNIMKGKLFLHPQDRHDLFNMFATTSESQEISPVPYKKLASSLVGCTIITSGLDGVFPRSLVVGKITKVFPPLEGECVFRFEAMPLSIWDDLCEVMVLEKRPG